MYANARKYIGKTVRYRVKDSHERHTARVLDAQLGKLVLEAGIHVQLTDLAELVVID